MGDEHGFREGLELDVLRKTGVAAPARVVARLGVRGPYRGAKGADHGGEVSGVLDVSAYKVAALLCDGCQAWDDFDIDAQPAGLVEVRKAARKAGWTREVIDPEKGKADLCRECSA